MEYILSIDQGTSSTRSIIFDNNGEMVAVVQKEHQQFYPHPSWVEHNPDEIKKNVLYTMNEVVKSAKLTWKDITAIGITNQRETIVAWDKTTGIPLTNAIVWQCRRTSSMIDELKKEGYADLFHKKTGLVLDAYFSGTKAKWMLDNIDKVKTNKNLAFGTIDSWIIYFLSGEHRTDASNASRTLLFDINNMNYSTELCEILGISLDTLPMVTENANNAFGYYSIGGVKIPIRGVLGDQQSALFGQTGFDQGSIKTTYGTGNFSLLNIGNKPKYSDNGLLTTVAWNINNKPVFASEGSVFITGAALRWLRDGLGIFNNYNQIDTIVNKEKDSGGVIFVPAFVGLGAPYWDSSASGTIMGISGGTNTSHLMHATLDAIAYQTQELIELMSKDTGIKFTSMNVDGGGTKSQSLMQKQADISQINIIIPNNIETTALGVAMMAGYKLVWEDLNDMREINPTAKKYFSKKKTEDIQKGRDLWNKTVMRCKSWY